VSPDRRGLRAVVGALVGLAAVALAAATLNSTTETGELGVGGEGGEGSGIQPGPVGLPEAGEGTPVDGFEMLAAALLLLAVVVVVAYVLANRRRLARTVVGAAAFLGVVALLVWLLRELGTFPEIPTGNVTGGDLLGGKPAEGEGGSSLPFPPALLLVLLAVAAVGVVAALRGGGDDDAEEAATTGADAAALGRAAGRAAERIDADASPDNEVYRAWREMTDLLDVRDPESTTPREFESAAVEAGMAREHVRALTRLFEDVRYGGTEPSPDLERRATETFERIADRYAGEP
jgi:hypothetical protein